MIHHDHFDSMPSALRRFQASRHCALIELDEFAHEDGMAAAPDFEFPTTARALGAGELALEDDTQVRLTVAALHGFGNDS